MRSIRDNWCPHGLLGSNPGDGVFILSERFISKNILTRCMIVKTVKVSEKGQIAIPLDMREETNICQGDELLLVQDGNKIMIESTEKISNKIKDDFSDILKFSEKSLMKIWDNKEDEIWNEYLKQ